MVGDKRREAFRRATDPEYREVSKKIRRHEARQFMTDAVKLYTDAIQEPDDDKAYNLTKLADEILERKILVHFPAQHSTAWDCEEENEMLRARIENVKALIWDAGPNPEYHRAVVQSSRSLWPLLWKAIDRLIDLP